MSIRSLRGHAICALIAAAIAIIARFAEISQIGRVGRHWVLFLAALPDWPAFWVIALLGAGSGPHGFPNYGDESVWVLTFVFWWVLIELGRAWMAKRRAARSRAPQR